jgi:hypothetical protein
VLNAVWGWFVAFFFTQVFELPIYWWATKSLRIGFFASAITHPIVWFVFPLLMNVGVEYWPMVVLAELFAIVAEATWLKWNGIPTGKAALTSLAANSFSVACGFAMRHFLGFP